MYEQEEADYQAQCQAEAEQERLAMEAEHKAKQEEAELLRVQKLLVGNPDAVIWAKEFVKIALKKPTIATDEAAMIGWFANAIMTGYDKAKKDFTKHF